jgi:hypothetical protein
MRATDLKLKAEGFLKEADELERQAEALEKAKTAPSKGPVQLLSER